MYEQIEKPKENKSRTVANSVGQKRSNGKQGYAFLDNRLETSAQSKLYEIGKYSPRATQLKAIQVMTNNSPQTLIPYQFQSIFNSSGVVQRVVNVGDHRYTLGGIIALLANDEIIGWDEDWRIPLKTLIDLETEKNFSDASALEEYLMNAEVHQEVSGILGFPLNWESQEHYGKPQSTGEVKNGESVALKILNHLQLARSSVLGTPDDSFKWVIFHAAAGVVTGTGVCDNFGSLAAVLLRIRGREDVSKLNAGGHVLASVGSKKVDAWEDLVHSGGDKPHSPVTETRIESSPEEVEALLDDEITACDEAMQGIWDALTEPEKLAYAGLLASRDLGEWGHLESRKEIVLQQEQRNRQRAEERERKRQLKLQSK